MLNNIYKKEWGIRFRGAVASKIGKQMARARLRQHNYREFFKYYPEIQTEVNWRQHNVYNMNNECGFIFGRVANLLLNLQKKPKRMLLAGEDNKVKKSYSDLMKLPEETFVTAGLGKGGDFEWDFDGVPSDKLGKFDVIVSHAMIEHLVDPYCHVKSLIHLLEPGGIVIVDTVMPGFPYHRYPVDCVRFFPDWFMEVAKRNHVEIYDQFIAEDHIVFTYRKPE